MDLTQKELVTYLTKRIFSKKYVSYTGSYEEHYSINYKNYIKKIIFNDTKILSI